ncbi:MAG: efflux RND transporter permease subunit, partial [Saprospiraceae bacterium]|nr:efflux RND transporter permease subunit [Saprospiraceae bacterium]
RRVLHFRIVVIVFSFAFLLFSLWWGKTFVGLNLFPVDGADKFFVYIEMDEASTFDNTDDTVKIIEQEISQLPSDEVFYYTTRIGTDTSDELDEQSGGQEHLAFIRVTLSPISGRDREADVIMEELRSKVEGRTEATSLRFEVEKPGPPAGSPVEFHVHGDNDEQRMNFVNRMLEDLKGMKGISDITSTHKVGREDYTLNLDYDKLAAVGLTVNDVASTLRIAFDGVDATEIVRDNEEIRLRLRFPKEYRQDVRNVLDLVVRNKDGKLVPLGSFASLGKTRAESAIHHTDGDVTTTIYAQTDGVNILPMTAITALSDKYSPELKDNPEISFSYGGEAEETQESVRSLILAFIGGFIGIYLVLILLFNSLSQPLMILAAVPLGLIGVVWTFYFHGRPFSFLGLIGVVGLSGVVVNNALIMVDVTNAYVRPKLKEGVTSCADLIDLVVQGAGRRLRPVIITTITTVAGLMPTAYGIGGADPFIEPMVLAIAWGLVFATLLTLFVIPSLYLFNLDLVFLFKKWRAKITTQS